MKPLKKIKHIHFVGIGGSGMIGIAYLLVRKGYSISGSDLNRSKELKDLKDLGAKIYYKHDEKNVGKADLLVMSSAIRSSNPEYRKAKREGITIIPRAQMLGSLMRGYESIAVAGSHGKTTTTSMIANIFSEAILSPTYIVGGKVLGIGKNSELGTGNYLIAEADESDGSFLHLQPDVGIFTNIDNDHLSYYDNDIDKLLKSFQMFAENIPFYGALIINKDDKNVRAVAKKVPRRKISFGFSSKSNYQITNVNYKKHFQNFNIIDHIQDKTYAFSLPMPGKHNLYNAAASIAAAIEEGISIKYIQNGLKNFKGVSRRFEKSKLVINNKKITFIDDYGHHPEEIKSTISAIHQAFPNKRICMIFEPHRYTRTAQLYNDFIEVLSTTDTLLLFDIYPASELPIKGISSRKLLESIKQNGHLNANHTSKELILCDIKNSTNSFDILVTQGAGSISSICEVIKKKWQI
ncbi:UDP-N-acetylmuramate--L-alanine ligase [Gammaproteobacteria bacterium]|nr:UDP-N-acetylmuramate--L-alanine ligase [Gammaproteobacteria bacterium]